MIWMWLACASPKETEETKEKLIQDYDQDGFFNDTDCDDLRSEVHPEAPEICDGLDNNCDDLIDDDDPELSTDNTWYKDTDGDDFGDPEEMIQTCAIVPGYSDKNTDCNDANENIYPNANELCNGFDDNCDNITDEDTSVDALVFYFVC